MNHKGLLNRIIILETYCLDMLGALPPGYSAMPRDERQTHQPYSEPPRQTALGHKPNGVTVDGQHVHTDAALTCLDAGD